MYSKNKHKKKIIVSTLLLTTTLIVYTLRLEAIGWYFWHNAHSINEKHSLNLKNYHVEIESLAINGIKNASELTYNPITKTLFTVLNKENQIVELSRKGEVLRTVDVTGVDDMEGITYIDHNQFVIADEHDNRLVLVHLEEKATTLDVRQAPKIRLGINKNGNKNFEGVSWDDRNKKLIVVKERDPKYVISVKGLVDRYKNGVINIEIEKLHQYDTMLAWAMRDLSGVKYLSKSGHTLLLSDESRLVKEFDENARPLGAMALWAGFHGLKKNIPQPEGITLDNEDNIYIISEPNLFYVFKPQSSQLNTGGNKYQGL
jgi:uncharacterized protein YjiK